MTVNPNTASLSEAKLDEIEALAFAANDIHAWTLGNASVPRHADFIRAISPAAVLSLLSMARYRPQDDTSKREGEDEADEAYEIGKRDGYSEAIQELDMATGGDGEYKWSSDGESVDVPVMKARVIERFASRPLEAEPVDGGDIEQAFRRLCEALGIPATACAYLEAPRLLAYAPAVERGETVKKLCELHKDLLHKAASEAHVVVYHGSDLRQMAETILDAAIALEKAERSVLSHPVAPDKLVEALKDQNEWVRAALECKDWCWDGDQRAAAEQSLADARSVLASMERGK